MPAVARQASCERLCRKKEFYDDLNTLENLLDESSQIRLFSPKVKEELGRLIYKLKHSNYNGLDKE